VSAIDSGLNSTLLALLTAYHTLSLISELALPSVASWGLNLTPNSSSCLFEQQPYVKNLNEKIMEEQIRKDHIALEKCLQSRTSPLKALVTFADLG
jgi:hypothetical protein